jgi:DNA mismatch repair protein MutS2
MKPLEIHPTDGLAKLKLNEILQLAARHCIGEEGREAVLALYPQTDPAEVKAELERVDEFRSLLNSSHRLAINYLPPITRLLNSLRAGTPFLTAEELLLVLRWLRTLNGVLAFFQTHKSEYPKLAELYLTTPPNPTWISKIEQIITEDGQIRPNASPYLVKLRHQQAEISAQLRQTLQIIMREAKSQGWTDEKELTVRNQRLVIPIKSDFKGKIKGLIQDLSASGQTTYLEPLQAVGLNNDLRELYLKEENEIRRLLIEVTEELRPHVEELIPAAQYLARIDSLRARAMLAIQLGCNLVNLDPNGRELKLIQARHPLLIAEKGLQNVVPLELRLDSVRRILVISGPNAGGKSVALQTVGLLQLMLQTGFLVPADSKSTFPVIRRIFVDLGDNQSIQNDLSTYSSHLSLMKVITERYESNSLLLLDEFGAGTDPQLGGAIAEALLREFARRRGFGVINTHYSNLKEVAEELPALVNGAMLFDLATISPTFRLEQGLPGSSFAFEIARRVGIPEIILRKAQDLVGEGRNEIESLTQTLRQQSEILEQRVLDYQTKERQLAELIDLNRKKEQELIASKNALQLKRIQTLEKLRADAQRQIDATLESLQAQFMERSALLKIRKQLDAALGQLEKESDEMVDAFPLESMPETLLQVEFTENGVPANGEFVRLIHSNAVGRLVKPGRKRSLVEVGNLRLTINNEELVAVGKAAAAQSAQPIQTGNAARLASPEVTASVSNKIDLRGFRVEDALPCVRDFMDQVIVSGLNQVAILHGKGTGALRMAIRKYLKEQYNQIKSLRDASDDTGGNGVTVVELVY